jgi:hypothetical protein
MLNRFFYFIIVVFFSLQSFAIQVNTGRKKFTKTRTFLDESFKIIRNQIKASTNLSANFSISCKPPGGTGFVTSDAFFIYKSTNYFSMTVDGECPYKVVVSNNLVHTTFTKTGENDCRPLANSENIFGDFLGIAPFYDQTNFVINFHIEDNFYLVSAVLKPKFCANLSLDFVNNARKAVQRKLWLDPNKDKVVKAQVLTFEGKETIFYY